MKYLLDTHLLLWASVGQASKAGCGPGLSDEAIGIIQNMDNEIFFSSATIWEIAIKAALGRHDFNVDANVLRRELLDNGYQELPINSEHAAAVAGLDTHHADPFDRIQIAQAMVEGITLLTHDEKIGLYGRSPIKVV